MNGLTLGDIVDRLGGELCGEGSLLIERVAALETAGEGDIAFVTAKHAAAGHTSSASALIVPVALAGQFAATHIACRDPQLYFARVATLFHPLPTARPGIHPSAVVSPSASLAPGVEVGPHVVIGDHAVIGEGVILSAGSFVGEGARIGSATILYARAVVEHHCVVGEHCILHPGCVIGADGFGNAFAGDHWEKIPQIGRVIIGNSVEIGANTTVDRGALADTVIEDGVRLDNLIHIAHNCHIGRHTAMAACVGVAGSTRMGAYCLVGGAGMVSGHLDIGDRVQISGGTLVAKSIRKPGVYTAVYPLAEHKEWLTNAARVRQLDSLFSRVKELERELDELKNSEKCK